VLILHFVQDDMGTGYVTARILSVPTMKIDVKQKPLRPPRTKGINLSWYHLASATPPNSKLNTHNSKLTGGGVPSNAL
jgi:hypothetical protein